MPEIAEIALTAQILEKYFKNQLLVDFEFISGRYQRQAPTNYQDFLNAMPLKVKKIDSRGKFMWFELINDNDETWYIWNTFGLTGMWSRRETNYLRAILTFSNNKYAFFSDMRNFGTFKFSQDKKELKKKLQDLSPDFLKDDNFQLDRITKYDIPIVKILMDQKKIGSGLGNYLVAEILYRAKISPYRLGSELNKSDLKKLEYWIKYIVKLSYIDNYVGYMSYLEKEVSKIKKKNYHPDIELNDESFDFLIYRKKQDPLGNPVKVSKIVGAKGKERSTYWVPNIQK